ncbi:hypothetical protein [Paenibacillus elgii]|uniref:hypothetical protein n=1 Tax=Paenibacillus elgii TaxID=189691 RepID=UPI0013D2BEE4|nr:hypothetical protein [Paenibacillus elgii]
MIQTKDGSKTRTPRLQSRRIAQRTALAIRWFTMLTLLAENPNSRRMIPLETVWVNIDHVQKNFVIHSEGGCHWVNKKAPSTHKMLNALGKHGGWLKFANRSEAEKYHTNEGLPHKVMPCGFCFPS